MCLPHCILAPRSCYAFPPGGRLWPSDDDDDGGRNNWLAKWQQRIFLAATLSEHFHSKLASAAGRCYIITERFPIIFEL